MGSLGVRELEDEVDDALRDRVGEAEVGARDGDEAQDDGRGLRDLTAVGPLDALQLGPGGAQEVDDAVALRLRAGRRGGRGAAGGRRGLGDRLALELGLVDVGGLAVGAGDDRGLDLVDLADVLKLTRDVLAVDVLVLLLGLASLRSLAIACHDRGLPGLPMARVAAAPLAVFAQRDALGIVALGLVGLVVAPLALLAGEGDTDAHVSAGHGQLAPSVRPRAKRRPAGGRSDDQWYYVLSERPAPSLGEHDGHREDDGAGADEGGREGQRAEDQGRPGVALAALGVGPRGAEDGQRNGDHQDGRGDRRDPDDLPQVPDVDDGGERHAGASTAGDGRKRRTVSQPSPPMSSTATITGPSAPWPNTRAKP